LGWWQRGSVEERRGSQELLLNEQSVVWENEKVLETGWCWQHNEVNALNVTEVYTCKWLMCILQQQKHKCS
jgi:hypothetical protein